MTALFVSIVSTFLCGLGVWVWRLMKRVARLEEVLSTATPELARRVVEQGTAVKLNGWSAWADEYSDELETH